MEFSAFSELFHWLVAFRSPMALLRDNPVLLLTEAIWLGMTAVVVCIAARRGPEYRSFLVASFAGCLTFELSSIFLTPRLPVWWYAPGTVTFVGWRIPLFVPATYVVTDFFSWTTARRWQLRTVTEASVSAIGYLVLLHAAEVLGTRHLLWSWHGSDPYTVETFHSVSYAEYVVLTWKNFGLVLVHKLLWSYTNNTGSQLKRFPVRWLLSAFYGCLATFLIFVSLILLFHVSCEKMGVCFRVIFWVSVAVYAIIICLTWRSVPRQKIGLSDMLRNVTLLLILFTTALFMTVPVFMRPENVRAPGLHQPIGPCDVMETVALVPGYAVDRRKYLCAEDLRSDQQLFDFHCVSEEERLRAFNSSSGWYTRCGVPVDDRATLCAVAWATCLVYLALTFQAYRYRPPRQGEPQGTEDVFKMAHDLKSLLPRKKLARGQQSRGRKEVRRNKKE